MATCQVPLLISALQSWKYRINRTLTCVFSNWSPPKAATQGLIPPVPKAIRLRPTNDRTLKWRGEDTNHVDIKHNSKN